MATKKKADDAVVVEQTAEQKIEPKVELVQFTKKQILASEKYCNNRDMVDALLDESKKYTMEQVDKLVDSYKKGTVK